MNCLSFNCWGEETKPIVRELATISQVLSHHFLFICETRQNKNNMCSLRRRLGLKGFAGFSSYGLSGVLALFWHEQIYVDVQSVNECFIDAYVRVSPNAPQWRLTCIYGEPRVEHHHLMWDTSRRLKNGYDLPWLIKGDSRKFFGKMNISPKPLGQQSRFMPLERLYLNAI
jgi:hypothetical protein